MKLLPIHWAVCLPLQDATALAPLRLVAGLQVAVQAQWVWLRGPACDERVTRLVLGLPALERYEVLGDNHLRRLDSRIPSGTLPLLEWTPLHDWLGVELPAPSSIGEGLGGSVALRLARSGEELPSDLLMTRFHLWQRFALDAPEVRLRALRFAVDVERNVLIRGRPLPPLPGRRFVLLENLAVPAGFGWQPAVSPEVVARQLGLPAEALALFFEDGTFTRVEAEQFVPATRSAVRATGQDLVSA